jgi:hypothetical protein
MAKTQVRRLRRTDGSGSGVAPDLKKEKLGTKTFLPVDIRY